MMYVEHALLALLAQIAIGRLTGNWWAGAALASGYFIGRELAQAEYRWIETFGSGLRANMPWWGPFDPRVWRTVDQVADWVAPLIMTSMLAMLVQRHRKAHRR